MTLAFPKIFRNTALGKRHTDISLLNKAVARLSLAGSPEAGLPIRTVGNAWSKFKEQNYFALRV